MPSLVKNPSHLPAPEVIKNNIDAVVNHAQGNATNSVGYGGILANSNNNNDTNTANNINKVSTNDEGLPSNTRTNATMTQLSPQDVIKKTYTGQVFQNANGTCQVSVPGMEETINGQIELTHIIQVPNCHLPVNKPVQVITTTPRQDNTPPSNQENTIQIIPYDNSGGSTNSQNPGSTTQSSNGGSTNSQNSGSTTQNISNNQNSNPPAPAYFQTVQLNAINQGTNAMLSYDDTTGQTIEVTVIMKNNEKTLFTGNFYASQFHTEVNDIPNTPHIIEMIIQNAIYGTLHASVYVPPDIQNSTIAGIFTNSTG